MSTDKKAEWVPFSQRPEWADVQPTPQDDGPNPLCPIAYSDRFRETMDYFRTILHKDELSPRAFDLVTEAIALNAANYTAWYFRRKVLDALVAQSAKDNSKKYSYEIEMDYLDTMCRANPKNYQLWYHRRLIVERLNDASEELNFTAEMLEEDAKNYHAWAHRQWAIEAYKLWDSELLYVESLIKSDMRNNSAWNQRYFVVEKTSGFKGREVIEREIEYAFSYIRKAPNNESPWAYLRGLFTADVKYSDYTQVKRTCEELSQMFVACPHVYATLVSILEREGTAESIARAAEHCRKLGDAIDAIHQKYWRFRESRLRSL